MGRRTDRLFIGIILAVLLGIGVVSWRIFSLKTGQPRNDAIANFGKIASALGGLGTAVTLAEKVWRARRPPDPRPVDTLAGLLAQAVREQWRKAAAEWMLVTPTPIRVSWSLSEESVAGPVVAAIGDADVVPAFMSLPGQSRVTEEQLRAGGGRGELFAVYAGIASGRMIVVGAPGAGKSGTAVLLLLDALAHRDRVEDKDRVRVPVPVIFTPHGWNPTTCSAQDWLVTRLAGTYPMFRHRSGHVEAAALIAAGAVTLILDGLDEMDVARRPAALQALNDAPFRVVVLTRGDEMIQAASAAWLVGAVALQLDNVAGSEAADYLQRACTGPPPSGWAPLLTHLRRNSPSALASALSTPLALTLVRDTYRPGDDVNALLTVSHGSTPNDIKKQLIARLLLDAYTPRPGRPMPRYTLTQAKHVLAFFARQMNQEQTRNLVWWHIPRWAPTAPRIFASMLVGGLGCGLFSGAILAALIEVGTKNFGVELLFKEGFPAGVAFGVGVGLPLGLAYGRGGYEPKRIRVWRTIKWRSILIAGFGYCLVVLVGGVALTVFLNPDSNSRFWLYLLAYGLMVSLPFAVTRGLVGGPGERDDDHQVLFRGRGSGRVLWVVVLLATAVAAVLGVVGQDLIALVIGLAVVAFVYLRLAAKVARRLVVTLTESAGNPQEPRASWRNDRVFRLAVGLVFGLGVGLPIGLSNWWGGKDLDFGPVASVFLGLAVMIAYGLVVDLAYGLTSSVTWSTKLAWYQLQRSDRVPAVDLMSFLEDARDRGVLRADGAVYQFRHATLQDHLDAQTTAVPQSFHRQQAAKR